MEVVSFFASYLAEGVASAGSWLATGQGMTAASMGMTAYGAAQTAEAQAKSGEQASNVATQNIQLQGQAMAEEAKERRKNTRRLLGAQRLAVSGSGVLAEGSPLMVMEESYQQGMADLDAMLERGKLGMLAEQEKGMFATQQAIDAQKSTVTKAGTTLLTQGISYKRGFTNNPVQVA